MTTIGTGDHVWGLVLAAGEGSRLQSLTARPGGTAVPKQFCSLAGGQTLLEDAISRAAGLVSEERICTIVAQQHREWWTHVLRRTPEKNIIVQPRNRGTAIGILYSLLHILARDPKAVLVMFPADHYVRDEEALRQALRTALHCVDHDDRTPVLLGLEPEEADSELGYILPGQPDAVGGNAVRQFVEKPEASLAEQLVRDGGLWNAFIIAASAQRLLDMFTQRFAALVMEMQVILSRCSRAGLPEASGWATLVELYERLPTIDFSRHLLEGREHLLRVVRTPMCGWSDLGTPRRVAETLRRLPVMATSVRTAIHRHDGESSAWINLAARHAQFETSSATA